MNFSTKNLCTILFIFLMAYGGRVAAQCGLQANQYSGCVGFTLALQDTTRGAGNTANWAVTLPAPATPSVIHCYNTNQCTEYMGYPGQVSIVMTDTINGTPCTASATVTVNPNPVIKGSFSATVTCANACVYWNDSSIAGAGCSPFREYYIYPGDGGIDSNHFCFSYVNNGTFTPSIYCVNSCGCVADTSFAPITVTAPPVASFTGTPLSSCVSPLSSTMTASTTNRTAFTVYEWYVSLAGGPYTLAQSTASNIFTYSYTTGIWSIKLVAIDTHSGCSDSTVQTNYVTAGANVAPSFTASDTSGCAGQYITFTPFNSGGTTYDWYFPGTGVVPNTGTSASPTQQQIFYGNPGTYNVQLIVKYNGNCKDTVNKIGYITLGQGYTVNFTATDTVSCTVPDNICVTYTGQACPTCTFSWNPPPNAPYGPGGQSGACYTINSYGQYSPALTVTDPAGCTSQLVKTNYFSVEPLHACATKSYPNGNGCALDTIKINNCTSGGPFTSVVWSFPGANVVSTTAASASVYYASPGCHDYSMAVLSQAGCMDTLRDSICIGTQPTIGISVSPHDICYEAMPNIFAITLTPGDTPTSVLVWPQGLYPAGAPTFPINPRGTDSFSYMYPDFGDFAFCYLATTQGCHGDTICLTGSADSVHIHPPIAKFKVIIPCNNNTDSVIVINQSVDATSTYWVFQGDTITNIDTLHIFFPSCGTMYPITLVAINDTFGCAIAYHDSTRSIPCYNFDFSFQNTRGCYYNYSSPATLTTTGTPPDSAATQWSATPASVPPAPIFAGQYVGSNLAGYTLYLAGYYDACVRVSYADGCIDTLCKADYIHISDPTASYTVDDSAGCVPVTVQFTNTSTDISGVITHFEWNFGDGSNIDSSTANPVHVYNTVGQFQAYLNITDSDGCTSTFSKQIQANTIVANFTESDTSTCTANPSPLNPITFTDSSTGFVAQYVWILPASLGATNANPGNVSSFTTQFTNQGYDSVGEVAIDQFGTCRDTVWKPIRVVNPVADYVITVPSDTFFPCPPGQVYFRDTSIGGICSYRWTFGDGNSSILQDPAALYTLPGIYPVKEVVTSCHGCVDSVTAHNITIAGPSIRLSANTTGGCPCLPITFTMTSWNADSVQFLSGGGIPAFQYAHVNRGTITNPAVNTFTATYCTVGVVIPTVRAIDATTGCIVTYDSLLIPIPIDTPTSNFSYQLSSCGSDSVCFTNTTSFATRYAHDSITTWRFGDGSTSNVLSPCHQYAAPGDYTVSLSTMDNLGCSDSITRHIHVAGGPVAYFTVDDTLGCTPFLVTFTDSNSVDDSTSIVSGYWNFGVNNAFATLDPTTTDTTYNYTTQGTFTATLVITDGNGCKDSMSRTIIAQAPPTVNVGPNPTICLGDTATLSGQGSSTLQWLSSYNIDSPFSATPRVWPTHDTTYVLQVGLLARCYVYDTVTVNVSTITISQDTAYNLCLNEQATFATTVQTTHATISSYNWSYGDGTTGTGQTSTHHYAAAGIYTDSLLVINSLGCRDSAALAVTIVDVPHTMLSVSADSVCAKSDIIATNLSTAGSSSPLSTFVFELTPAAVTPTTTSPDTLSLPAGTYTLYLIQMDNNQCVDTAHTTIVVHTNPVAGFDNPNTCINVSNQYVSTSTPGDGAITQYGWTVDGTADGNTNSISYTFTTPGTETICLGVIDVYGCADTICQPVVINTSPTITLTPPTDTICAGYSAKFIVSGVNLDSVQWVPSTWVSDPKADTVTITPRQTISYQVYGFYQQCIPAIDTVNIWVIDSVPVSATANPENILLGLSSNVTSAVKGTIDSITWSPDSTLNCRNCMNPVATPHETTTYTATVYYHAGTVVCSNQTTVTVTVFQSCDGSLIYVPNTFSPDNANGLNTVFRIRGEGITKVNYFRVYDRWGKKVFEADNASDPNQAGWNGCLNNNQDKPQNSGVYVYDFQIQCTTGQTYSGKGNVTLIR